VLTRDPRLRAQRLCHYLNHAVPGLFRPNPAQAGRAEWRFSDPPDDKTVRESHFCSSRYPSTSRTKLLSAELVGAIQTSQGLRPWLVANLSWRAARALDRYGGHSEYEIPQDEARSGPAALGSMLVTVDAWVGGNPGSGQTACRSKSPTKSAEVPVHLWLDKM
jgi:hypothetical protein